MTDVRLTPSGIGARAVTQDGVHRSGAGSGRGRHRGSVGSPSSAPGGAHCQRRQNWREMTSSRSRAGLALALPVILFAVAYLAAGASASRTAGPLDGKTVGLTFCTDQNPFCAAWIKAFKGYLEGKGAKVTVLTSVFDPATDANNMNQLIAAKPDLIAITPA